MVLFRVNLLDTNTCCFMAVLASSFSHTTDAQRTSLMLATENTPMRDAEPSHPLKISPVPVPLAIATATPAAAPASRNECIKPSQAAKARPPCAT